ncbi:hypothetical protein Cgig2_011916 [Carnegiea gigantea]|uniref:Uncharacterized protein n=1 Tax=Carnegiea gigantea TaxID=171969 RepID=A0A9Q1QC07_9CARY|nr:hypothetical protein Cgig2_011916 [Carnegiea gigantea]
MGGIERAKKHYKGQRIRGGEPALAFLGFGCGKMKRKKKRQAGPPLTYSLDLFKSLNPKPLNPHLKQERKLARTKQTICSETIPELIVKGLSKGNSSSSPHSFDASRDVSSLGCNSKGMSSNIVSSSEGAVREVVAVEVTFLGVPVQSNSNDSPSSHFPNLRLKELTCMGRALAQAQIAQNAPNEARENGWNNFSKKKDFISAIEKKCKLKD